jgi:hypothetical protein
VSSSYIYIAGLPHSGTTLLSLLLGKHPSLVALGEVNLQLRRMRERPADMPASVCGCGSAVTECPLWGPVWQAVSRGADSGADHRLVRGAFASLYGDGAQPVDASKLKEPLFALADAGHRDVRVIHLARDFRSAVASDLARHRRSKNGSRPGWLLGLQFARRWVRENRKIDAALQKTGFPALRLGYEELVLVPRRAWPLMWEFLGLGSAEIPEDIAGSRNHIFVGNLMRGQEAKREVRYDGRWFQRTEWLAPMLMFPSVRRGNRRWVYGNDLVSDSRGCS